MTRPFGATVRCPHATSSERRGASGCGAGQIGRKPLVPESGSGLFDVCWAIPKLDGDPPLSKTPGRGTSTTPFYRRDMDKTDLVARVADLLRIADHDVQTSVQINNREIDVVATERTGFTRKTLIIECADYAKAVGVDKMESDLGKLRAAREFLGARGMPMHVSRWGYSPAAAGLALNAGVDALSLAELTSRLVNFAPYVKSLETDPSREAILREYQPTRVHFDNEKAAKGRPAPDFLQAWLRGNTTWLTVLGDYGVGKSWMLKALMYELLAQYKRSPDNSATSLLCSTPSLCQSVRFPKSGCYNATESGRPIRQL